MKHMKQCRRCWWSILRDQRQLEAWLEEKLGAEFRYQWSLRDELGREESRSLRYVHPETFRRWLEEGPCKGCPCERHCDEVCALRARWWDARVARLRTEMSTGDGSGHILNLQ